MSTQTQFEFTFTTNPEASLVELQKQVAQQPDGCSVAVAEIKDTDISVVAYKNLYARGMGFGVVIDGKQYGAYGIESVLRDKKMTVQQLVDTVIRSYIESWRTPERSSAFAK